MSTLPHHHQLPMAPVSRVQHQPYFPLISRACMAFVIFFFVHATVKAEVTSPRTFAVVVGISEYLSPGIPSLEFADRDALQFVAWLKSPAGGQVADSNIVLLCNRDASYTAVYHALDHLVETCREGDLVYFYFSGHGDMESSTLYKLGFLLTHNTPRNNYINNALRIEDLNNYANTLSVNAKAKVILITDACHSGQLAGTGYRGSYLVGEQLKTVKANEVRIASCAPGQLSVEDAKWGGGRGVFSFHLLNGLTGFAEQDRDGKITVKELDNYLQTSLANDIILKGRGHQQTPVIKGSESFVLSRVNDSVLQKLKESLRVGQVFSPKSLPPLPPDLVQTVFKNLNKNPETYCDYGKLLPIDAADLPLAIVAQLKQRYRQSGQRVLDMLEQAITQNPDVRKKFVKKFVEVIADRGQQMINYYLMGDEAEMERRRYYNSFKNEYGTFAKMFGIACKLTDSHSPLARILEIKYHYFSGVALRLQMSATGQSAALIDSAFAAMSKALLLEENAAYIHNEMGFLYLLKNENDRAEAAFKRACEIAPTWAVPWSNLANLSLRQNNFDIGLNYIRQAKSIQDDYVATYINAGLLYEKKHNWLAAEENLRKSIALNSRFYLPFERLVVIYTQTTQYALADSFFYEAACRKKGFFVDPQSDGIGDGGDDNVDQSISTACTPPVNIAPGDIAGHFARAMKMIESNQLPAAEAALKTVISLDKKHPLAHHYLGRVLRLQKRWMEAEIFFVYAQRFYLDKTRFARYCDSMANVKPTADKCIRETYLRNYYSREDDLFLLGDVYEQWNHFSEAESCYQKVISKDSTSRAGYQKLWQLFERTGRYDDAEKLLVYFHAKRDFGPEQMNAFYKRVTEKYPDSGEWFYRAGSFHYHEAILHPNRYPLDVDKRTPDKDINPSYNQLYEESDHNYTFDLSRKNQYVPGTRELLDFGETIQFPRTKAIAYLRSADSLLADESIRADINAKIGDLFVAMNNIQSASPYYLLSSKLQSDNAGLRSKLLATLDAGFQFEEAMKQMDTLKKRNELTYHQMLLMTKYLAHIGEYETATDLLKLAIEINPLRMPEIDDLHGRIFWFSGKFNEAMPFYMAYLNSYPSNANAMYTVSRLCLVSGKRDDCYAWLKKSVSNGFSYYWVLQNDPIFVSERNTAEWRNIVSTIKPLPLKQTNQSTQTKQ